MLHFTGHLQREQIKTEMQNIKGGVSDFLEPMLIFQFTKTTTPLPQKGLAPILIAYTYIRNTDND